MLGGSLLLNLSAPRFQSSTDMLGLWLRHAPVVLQAPLSIFYHCDYLTIRALQGWCRSVLDMDIDVMVLGWDVDLETSKIDIFLWHLYAPGTNTQLIPAL